MLDVRGTLVGHGMSAVPLWARSSALDLCVDGICWIRVVGRGTLVLNVL